MLTDPLIALYALLHGDQDPVYLDKVYQPVATALIVTTIVMALIYYFVVTGFWARFNKWFPHWFGFLAINALVNVVAVLVITHDRHLEWSMATVTLCLINIVVAAISFVVASFVVKWFSPHGRKTPI